MRPLSYVPFAAFVFLIAVGLLFGLAGLRPELHSALAAPLDWDAKLHPSDTTEGFGISAAVSGDTAIIGAYIDDDAGTDAGAAYIFQRDQGGAGNWGQVIKLAASDGEADDRFGISVAVSGDTVVVGIWDLYTNT